MTIEEKIDKHHTENSIFRKSKILAPNTDAVSVSLLFMATSETKACHQNVVTLVILSKKLGSQQCTRSETPKDLFCTYNEYKIHL